MSGDNSQRDVADVAADEIARRTAEIAADQTHSSAEQTHPLTVWLTRDENGAYGLSGPGGNHIAGGWCQEFERVTGFSLPNNSRMRVYIRIEPRSTLQPRPARPSMDQEYPSTVVQREPERDQVGSLRIHSENHEWTTDQLNSAPEPERERVQGWCLSCGAHEDEGDGHNPGCPRRSHDAERRSARDYLERHGMTRDQEALTRQLLDNHAMAPAPGAYCSNCGAHNTGLHRHGCPRGAQLGARLGAVDVYQSDFGTYHRRVTDMEAQISQLSAIVDRLLERARHD